jgi:hypothetical protein
VEPNGLSRRIEELAAMAGDDEPEVVVEESDESASLGVVRAEIAALRADLIGMRGEMGSVRTDIDGLSGRLTGSVAAGRTETGALARRVAELVNRVEVVGARVEDVKTDLPVLVREVRDGLELVPVRTGAKLDELTGKLSESVGTRVEAVAADVRRTLAAGLEREADSAAATQGLMTDTRASLESRITVLEETIDALVDRLENLTREGTSTTADQLREMTAGIKEIEQRVEATAVEQVERIVARLRDVTETRLDNLANTLSDATRARNEQLRRELMEVMNRASTEQEATRAQVDLMAEAVKQSAADQAAAAEQLEQYVTTSLTQLREEVSTELDDVAERLLVTVTDLRDDQRAREELAVGRMSALQMSIEAGTEAIRSQVIAGLDVARAEIASEVATLGPRIDEVLAAAAAAATADQESRTELQEALDTVRERVAVAVSASTESVRAGLEEFTTRAIDAQRVAHEALLDRLSDQHAAVTGRLADVGAASSGTTAASRETGERLAALTIALDEVRRTVEALQGDWPKKSDQAAAAARSAAEGVLAEMRAEVRKQLDAVIGEVARAAGGIEDAKGRLATAVDQVAEQAALQRQETVAALKLAGTRASLPPVAVPPPATPAPAPAPTQAPAPEPVASTDEATAAQSAGAPTASPAPAKTAAKKATKKAAKKPAKKAAKKAPAKAAKAPAKKAAKAPAKKAAARSGTSRASLQSMPQVPSPGAAVDAAVRPAAAAASRPAPAPTRPTTTTAPARPAASAPAAPRPAQPAGGQTGGQAGSQGGGQSWSQTSGQTPTRPSTGTTGGVPPRPQPLVRPPASTEAGRPDAPRPATPPAEKPRRLFGRRK